MHTPVKFSRTLLAISTAILFSTTLPRPALADIVVEEGGALTAQTTKPTTKPIASTATAPKINTPTPAAQAATAQTTIAPNAPSKTIAAEPHQSAPTTNASAEQPAQNNTDNNGRTNGENNTEHNNEHNNENNAHADNSNNWELYTQLQALQKNIEQLQGTVEEQAHQIQQLKSDLRTRYTDLDQRLVAQQNKSADNAAPQNNPPQNNSATSSTAANAAPNSSTPKNTASPEDEKKSYLAAYDTFRAGGPDKAIPPMMAFVMRYPNSTLTPNAYYWLGEFYLNASTPDQSAALKNFDTVLNKYPDSGKAAAALYKIASILDLQNKPTDAAKKMALLKTKYPNSPEAALAESYLKALEKPTKPISKTPAKKTSH